jgi:hypothetical protein
MGIGEVLLASKRPDEYVRVRANSFDAFVVWLGVKDPTTEMDPRVSSTSGQLVPAPLPSHSLMLVRSRCTLLMLVAVAVSAVACDSPKSPDMGIAAAPANILPPFQQEIASVRAEITLPGVWKYGYRMVDRPDSTYGAFRAIEFHYTADSALKVPPRLLLIIRAFKKPAWERVRSTQGDIARLLATHGDDVYVFSVVTSNPYTTNSASALRVDQMMLTLTAETSPFRMTFKDTAR